MVAYLFKVYKISSSYASLVMTHAALKWFHSFGLSNGANPLDSSICHNLLEAARRDKPGGVLKRRLYLLRLLRVALLRFLVLLLINLDDIRAACIYLLGFAGFFRYDELIVTSRPRILNFFLITLQSLFSGLKMTFIAKVIVYIKRLAIQYFPVALLKRYISMCNIELYSSVALFRPVYLTIIRRRRSDYR